MARTHRRLTSGSQAHPGSAQRRAASRARDGQEIDRGVGDREDRHRAIELTIDGGGDVLVAVDAAGQSVHRSAIAQLLGEEQGVDPLDRGDHVRERRHGRDPGLRVDAGLLGLVRRGRTPVRDRSNVIDTVPDVHVGALIFPTDRTIRPDVLALELEARGFESLWVAEHTHIPVSRRTPYPGGGDLPDMYWRTLDPFVALTAAALSTERLKIGTGICLVNQHHPINVAKQTASLDLLSGGRFLFGVGVGWNEDEMEHHGTDPAKRRTIARERILATKALWTQEEASFDGEFVQFSPSVSLPKPVQSPHPPIIMGGGGGPVTFRHIVEYCDGWMPIHGRTDPLEKLPLLQQMCEDVGRDPASIEIGIYGCPMRTSDVERYREAGVDRVVFWLPADDPERVMAAVDHGATLIG